MDQSSWNADTRGVSETLGYIFLVMIIVAGAGLIVYLGGGTMELVRNDATASQAEAALVNLNSALIEVSHSPSQTQIEHALGINPHAGGTLTAMDGGHMKVELAKGGGGTTSWEQSLNKIKFEGSDTEFLYQTGAVFELQPDEEVVSPPAIHIFDGGNTGDTLSVTAIGVTSDSRIGRNTYISHASGSPTRGRPRVLDNGDTITITVSNIDHPDIWKDALEQSLLGHSEEYDGELEDNGVTRLNCGSDYCEAEIDAGDADLRLLHVTEANLKLQNP